MPSGNAPSKPAQIRCQDRLYSLWIDRVIRVHNLAKGQGQFLQGREVGKVPQVLVTLGKTYIQVNHSKGVFVCVQGAYMMLVVQERFPG
jgi:hypothetical protein